MLEGTAPLIVMFVLSAELAFLLIISSASLPLLSFAPQTESSG